MAVFKIFLHVSLTVPSWRIIMKFSFFKRVCPYKFC